MGRVIVGNGGRAEAEVIAFEIRRTEKCGDATITESLNQV